MSPKYIHVRDLDMDPLEPSFVDLVKKYGQVDYGDPHPPDHILPPVTKRLMEVLKLREELKVAEQKVQALKTRIMKNEEAARKEAQSVLEFLDGLKVHKEEQTATPEPNPNAGRIIE